MTVTTLQRVPEAAPVNHSSVQVTAFGLYTGNSANKEHTLTLTG